MLCLAADTVAGFSVSDWRSSIFLHVASPIHFSRKIVFIGDQTFWWTPLTELTFHAESYPQYIGSEYFSMDDDDVEYRIILPFDADIERYVGDPEYIMQMKNVTIIFCEDPSYASRIQIHFLNA